MAQSVLTTALLAAVVIATPARASGEALPDDARLGATRAELVELVESAARDGLPEGLLVDKVREGLAKNIPPPRIAEVVRGFAAQLASARVEIAPRVAGTPTARLLKAVVDAHVAGVAAADLAALLAAAAPKGPATETRAVEVLTDLVVRGYPAPAAARTVGAVAARHPGSLDRLAAAAESLTAGRGVNRVDALDALSRSAAAGLGLDGAGPLVRHGGAGSESNGPNRETSGPRGPAPGNGNGNGHGHGRP